MNLVHAQKKFAKFHEKKSWSSKFATSFVLFQVYDPRSF